jgi:hypothetical protein
MPDVLIDEPAFLGWVGGERTRGQAVARFMEGLTEAGYAVRFTDFCAHRVFGRLVPRSDSTKGWEVADLPDHYIERCERSDDGAVPYWEVTFA